MVNAVRPAAIGAGADTGIRVSETALRALAGVLPEAAVADTKGTVCNVALAGVDPRTGRYFVFYEAIAGGYGGRARQDGMDAVQAHFQNTENAPIEETEASYPLRIDRYGLVQDSEGAGRQRGGLGLRRDYVGEGDLVVTVMAERSSLLAAGPVRWRTRAAGALHRRTRAATQHRYPSKFSARVPAGELMSLQLGGGGGYGPPLERDPDAVAADVASGRVSRRRATAGLRRRPRSRRPARPRRTADDRRAAMAQPPGRRR